MSTVHMMIGIPGSGKSTYADDLAYEFVKNHDYTIYISLDSIRASLIDHYQEPEDSPGFSRKIEHEVWSHAYTSLDSACRGKAETIWDCTNLSPDNRAKVTKIARLHDMRTVAYVFEASTDILLCMRRNRERERFVPEEVIGEMFIDFVANCSYEQICSEDFDEVIIVPRER